MVAVVMQGESVTHFHRVAFGITQAALTPNCILGLNKFVPNTVQESALNVFHQC